MNVRIPLAVGGLLLFLWLIYPSSGGEIYRITSSSGFKNISYEVHFGGGKSSGKWTAFCPTKKEFVYLSWPLDKNPPQPVAQIWDHRTGETIKLYRFPDSPDPLPVIDDVRAIKVCPFTGDRNFKITREGFYD